MEINKEIDEIIKIINRIFKAKCEEFVKYTEENYGGIFKYDKYIIKFDKVSDREYKDFLEIYFKVDDMNYSYDWSQFHVLYAYYENKSYNMKFSIKQFELSLKLLKKYIDSNTLFYNYSTLDYNKCYFYMEGIVKQVSPRFTYESAMEERFHEEKYRIINNKPIYK